MTAHRRKLPFSVPAEALLHPEAGPVIKSYDEYTARLEAHIDNLLISVCGLRNEAVKKFGENSQYVTNLNNFLQAQNFWK